MNKTNNKLDEKIQQQMEQDKTVNKELLKDFSPTSMLNNLMASDIEETEKDKIIQILFEHKDIRKIADISEKNMINISVLLTFAKEVDVPLVDYFCDTYLSVSLSKDRQSRKEVVEIYKTHMMEQSLFLNTPEQKSRFGRMKDKLSL